MRVCAWRPHRVQIVQRVVLEVNGGKLEPYQGLHLHTRSNDNRNTKYLVLTRERYLTRLTATMSNVEQIESYLLVSLNQTSGADGALCPVCIV